MKLPNVQSFVISVRPPTIWCETLAGSLPVTTMTSADFSGRFPCSETSPGKSFFPSSNHCGIYISVHKIPLGRYKGVVAYLKQICLIYRSCSSVPEFAVSLPSLLSSPTTSLRLANASGTTPRIRDFHPLEKKNHPRTIGIFNKICKFDIFTDLRWWVHCSCRAHTRGIKNCQNSWLFKGCSPFQLLCNLTGNRPQSATFHTANR